MPLPRKRLVPGILLALMLAALAAPPAWWRAGNPPVITGAPENNHGPANIGQAKHMAKSALDVLRPILPAVATQIENDLAPIVDLSVPDPKTPEWIEKQKAPLLIGQLKAIADPFYTRLHAAAPAWLEAERTANQTNHPNSIFPWTAETTDDQNKAIATIGQLKAVFSLRFDYLDSDSDGLPDAFEYQIINHSLVDGITGLSDVHPSGSDIHGDFDGDGLDNLTEFLQGTDPTSIYSGGTVRWPKDAIVAWYRTDGTDVVADETTGVVTEWKNSLGTSQLMSQPAAENRPTLVGNILNGGDVVRFGSDDWMRIGSGGLDLLTPGTEGFSIFGVFKMGTPAAGGVSSILSNEVPGQSGFRFGVNQGALAWWSNESGGTLPAASMNATEPVADGNVYGFALNHQGSGAGQLTQLHVNGELQSEISGAQFLGNSGDFLLNSIGGMPSQSGDWGELIIARRALTRGEATLVQDYLRAKHRNEGPLAATGTEVTGYKNLDFGTTPGPGSGQYTPPPSVLVPPAPDGDLPPHADYVQSLQKYMKFDSVSKSYQYTRDEEGTDTPEEEFPVCDVSIQSWIRTNTYTSGADPTAEPDGLYNFDIPFIQDNNPGESMVYPIDMPVLYAFNQFNGDMNGNAVETDTATWAVENLPNQIDKWSVTALLFKTGHYIREDSEDLEDDLVNELIIPSGSTNYVGMSSPAANSTDLVSGSNLGELRMEVIQNQDPDPFEFQWQLFLMPEFYDIPADEFEAQEDQSTVSENDKIRLSVYRGSTGEPGTEVGLQFPLGAPYPDLSIMGGAAFHVRWDFVWTDNDNDVNFVVRASPNSSGGWTTENNSGSFSIGGQAQGGGANGNALSDLRIKIYPPEDMDAGTTGRLEVTPVIELIDSDGSLMREIDLGAAMPSGVGAFLEFVYTDDEDSGKFVSLDVDVDEASGSEYRKISMTGRPITDRKPQGEEETDEEPEDTFVDALSRDLSHSTTDIYVPVPASDLVLCVRRNASPETWNQYSGLLPEEKPNLEFGPGWSSNLGAHIRIDEQVKTDDGALIAALSYGEREGPPKVQQTSPNTAVVTDEHGRSYRFVIGYAVNQQGGLIRSFIPMPTAGNQAESYLASLVQNAGGSLTFTKKFGTAVTFSSPVITHTISGNRVFGSYQATKYSYCRVDNVKDRHGVMLDYSYSGPNNLVPSRIEAVGRDLAISITQDNGRVVSVRDPKGNEITYHYSTQVGGGNGAVLTAPALVLDNVKRAGFITADYGYNMEVEDDHAPQLIRPWGKPLNGGDWQQYSVAMSHINLSSIKDAYGNETRFSYVFDLSRERYAVQPVYSVVNGELSQTGAFNGNVIQSGLPRDVARIDLPGGRHVDIKGDHHVRANMFEGIDSGSRATNVTDAEGVEYDFIWDAGLTHVLKEDRLSYVYSDDSISKTQVVGYPSMGILYGAGQYEHFEFDPNAGYALKRVTDFSGNVTEYQYLDRAGKSGKFESGAFSKFGDPNVQIKKTSLGDLYRHFTYDEETRVMSGIKDELNRNTTYGISNTGLRTSELVKDASQNPLSSKSFQYSTSLKAFLEKTTVLDFGDLPGGSDPSWVSNLITINEPDSNGRVRRSAVDMDGDGTINAGDLISEFQYDRNGNKLTSRDPEGNMTYFQYDSFNRLTAVIKPNETFQTLVYKLFTYDRRGNKVFEKDERGIATAYVYDATNRRVQTVRDMNRNLTCNPAATDLANLFTGIDPGTDIITGLEYNNVNSPEKATDARGFITVTEYDHLQRPERVITPKENTPAGAVPTVATGYVTQLFYDGENPGSSAFDVSGFKPTKTVDPRGYETLVTYDDLYRPVLTLKQYGAGLYAKTRTEYDDVGNVLEQEIWRTPTDSDGNPVETPVRSQITKTDYDDLNRPVTVTKAFGSDLESQMTTRYTTTGFAHQMVEEIAVDPGSSSIVTRTTDQEYDLAGRMVKTYAPAVPDETGLAMIRPLTQSIYDGNGNLTATINPLNHRWDYVYDSLNRRIFEIQPAVVDGLTGQSARPVIRTDHDGLGNVIRTTDARGQVTTLQYDDANRVVTTLSPPVEVNGSMAVITTMTDYDANGNATRVLDGRGSATINAYDSLNRLDTTKANPVAVASNASHSEDIVVHNYYDAAGNLTTVVDGAGQTTSFEYDGLNRKTKTIWDSNDPNRKREETTYYDAAVAIRFTDPSNQITDFTYDARFRLTDTLYQVHAVDNTRRTYDLADRLLTVEFDYPNEPPANQPTRSTVQTYDALDRVLTETSNGVTHTTRYDAAGNIRNLIYGGTNRKLTSQYDALNRLTQCDETDSAYPQTGIIRTTAYAYDLNGNIVRKTLPNNSTETKTYDALNRATRILNQAAGVTSTYDYDYDAVGNVARVGETHLGGTLENRVITNTYDKTNRLKVEVITAGTATETIYTYDKANNRTEKRVDAFGSATQVWSFVYGNAANGYNSNQLVSYTRPGLPQVNFTYDANGNRETRTIGSAIDYYGYDQGNRLISLDYHTDPAKAGMYQYAYDHRTRRVLRDESGAGGARTLTVFYGGLSVQEYEEVNGSVTLQVETIRGSDYGGGVGGVLYTMRGGVPSYNTYNSRGDVVGKTDDSGSATWQAAYEAFGTRTEEDGTTADRQKANTKDEDPTGLLNEGFRYRDLEAGIFITRDPMGFVDGPNVYTYVRQNPWTMFDPDGLEMFGIQTNQQKRTDTFTFFGQRFTVGGEGTNYNAGWLNGQEASHPAPVVYPQEPLADMLMGVAKDIPRSIKNVTSNPLDSAKQIAGELMEYPGNPSSMGRAVLAKGIEKTPQLITEGKIATDYLKNFIGVIKSSRETRYETVVELDKIIVRATNGLGKPLGGMISTFDSEARSLYVDFVGVAKKGKGLGTELYKRTFAAAGDVKTVTGYAAVDNAKAIKSGGIEAAPRTKILDKLGEWFHSYDENTKMMKAERK